MAVRAEASVVARRLRIGTAGNEEALLRALRNHDGVESAEMRSNVVLTLRYDRTVVQLDALARMLESKGAVVRQPRWWLALLTYCDQVHRESLATPSSWDARIRRIYVSRRHLREGSRDERPQHWRKYLHYTGGPS